MKKKYLLIAYSIVILFSANAQSDKQISVQTDQGILTISKTVSGKDMLIISIERWDEITAGTKYSTHNLSATTGTKLCIQITDKKRGSCKRGIGFGCGFFDCPYVPDPLPNRVDADNRICAVMVRKIKGAVKIIFIDNVNWQSLQDSIE